MADRQDNSKYVEDNIKKKFTAQSGRKLADRRYNSKYVEDKVEKEFNAQSARKLADRRDNSKQLETMSNIADANCDLLQNSRQLETMSNILAEAGFSSTSRFLKKLSLDLDVLQISINQFIDTNGHYDPNASWELDAQDFPDTLPEHSSGIEFGTAGEDVLQILNILFIDPNDPNASWDLDAKDFPDILSEHSSDSSCFNSPVESDVNDQDWG